MKRKALKIISLVLIWCIIAAPCLVLGVLNAQTVLSVFSKPDTPEQIGTPALVLSASSASESYKNIKEKLLNDEGFEDLIIDTKEFHGTVFLCNDEAEIEYNSTTNNEITYHWATVKNPIETESFNYISVYCSSLINNGYIELTEGSAINNKEAYTPGEPVEIIVGSDSKIPINSKTYITLGICDSDNKELVIPAKVVGKATLHKRIPLSGMSNISNIDGHIQESTVLIIQNIYGAYNFMNKMGEYNGLYKQRAQIFKVQYYNSVSDNSALLAAAQDNNAAIIPNYLVENLLLSRLENVQINNSIIYLVVFVLIFATATIVLVVKIISIVKVYKND